MGLGVGGVDKLAGDKAVRDFLRQLLGLLDGSLHALAALGQHQLRPVGPHDLPALHRHGFRHGDDHPVAAGGGDCSQADAGVAAGGLDDDGAGLELPALLGVPDHGPGDPVLDGTGGVQVLQLGQEPGGQGQLGFDVVQLDQGSAANQLRDGMNDVRHG